tara:strand:- start:120 stop:398 length:279 start_codon:yes stop_codon:yes gene_type:complete
VPDPHPKNGLCKIKLVADLKITILGVFIKKFNPLILKNTSGKNSNRLTLIVAKNIKIMINKINMEEIIKILLIPAKKNKVEIIPSNAFFEFV